MNIPEGPIHCDVCDKDSMFITQAKQADGQFAEVGIFVLPTAKIDDKEFKLHPHTALCSDCGQVKIFLKSDGMLPNEEE